MGIFVKLMGLAVAVGAGYAAVKIANKYEENKQNEVLDDDEDFNTPQKKSTFEDVKKAACEVYCETGEKVKKAVKTKAETIGINTDEVTEAFSEMGTATAKAGKAVAHASVVVAGKIKEEAPAVVQTAKDIAGEATKQVKNAVSSAAEKISKKPSAPDVEVYVDYEDVQEVSSEPVSEDIGFDVEEENDDTKQDI